MSRTYPIQLMIEGRSCLVVGGGEVAARKAEALLEARAEVRVAAPRLMPAMQKLVDAGLVSYIAGKFDPAQLDDVALVIAATDDQSVNRAVHRHTSQRGLLVNVVDQPELCSFIVPAVVRRGELCIAISTGGAGPALAKRLRRELEQQFGEEYAEYLEIIAACRDHARQRYPHDVQARMEAGRRVAQLELLPLISNGERERADAGGDGVRVALVGANHRCSSLGVREQLAFPSPRLGDALRALHACDEIAECLILSTCNRTELLAAFKPELFNAQRLSSFLAEQSGLAQLQVCDSTYTYLNGQAVSHLFEVASGLDSMVLGETQILGQLKDAYRAAVEAQTTGPLLNKLMHITFRVAKRVRSETGIGRGSLSVSQVACDLAAKIFLHLEQCRVLLIGAGENAELAARILRDRGVQRLTILNRTLQRAQELANRLDAEAGDLQQLDAALCETDIVISSTGSPQPLLGCEQIARASAKRRRPLFLIDMAVPRDIEPGVESIEGVFLYDIDDLGRQVEANLATRKDERRHAMQLIASDTERFAQWHMQFKVTPTIKQLQQTLESIRMDELEKIGAQLSPEVMELVDGTTRRMTKRMLAHPILHVKNAARQPNAAKLIQLVREIMGLPEEHS
ncbi:MAG: glutamyl-tRNA reductase [Candidatus Alcyoniella australis]|nr:glutamyl-tRNA reductase [Candidatus Alcyoniella australis]